MDVIRFGLIGTGRITSWVLKGAVLEPRFKAQAICSRSMPKAEDFAREHAVPCCYDCLDEMLASDLIDAVYIGTPNHTHCDLAIKCMEAGKHVLCEKPLASSPSEVRRMMEAASKNGVVLMEAMISTLNPNFIRAQKEMEKLGKIRKYYASFCQYSSKCKILEKAVGEADYEAVPASFNPMASGGALMDVGIYTIYPMVVLFGRPEQVNSHAVTMEVPVSPGLTMPIDVQASAEFHYPGMNASISYSKITDSFLPTEICGEGGNLVLDKIHICRNLVLRPHAAPSSGRGQDAEPIDLTSAEPEDEYTCEFTEFINLIEGKEAYGNNSLENSLIVSEIMSEIRRQSGIKFPSEI